MHPLPQLTTYSKTKQVLAGVLALGLLAGCDENGKFSLPSAQGGAQSSNAGAAPTGKLVERDVEAPEVFSATDQGLWDGRPSLGGVWVAHPDVSEPERVIIRNEANNKFVIGALFRKERDLPGPKLQISSDAAAALGILAGAPAPLNVTALRREEAVESAPAIEEAATDTVAAPAEVSETSLDPIAAAGAAIEAAPATPVAAPSAPAPAAKPASSLAKPFVQLGIFSVEANATRVAKQMRGAGIVPTVKKSQINGKPFWRVVVGPASSKSELNNLIKAIKAEGFSDAYAVTN
ncbi:MAG: SPOR domain-containing protein [Sulfitobacter sp.]